MAYPQTQPALLMKGTYSVVTIFKNAAQRTGKPWWNIMLADGGKLPCFVYSAISGLIGQAEDRRDYNPPIMVEFYIDPRTTGAVIVPKPAVPPASTVIPPPPPAAPAPGGLAADAAACGSQVVYGQPPAQVYPGTAGPAAVAPQYRVQTPPVQAAAAPPATQAPVQQPPAQQPQTQQPQAEAAMRPLPGEPAMTKGEEVKRREAMEFLRNEQIARMNGLTQIVSAINASAFSGNERLNQIVHPANLQKAALLTRYILTGEIEGAETVAGEDAPF
jgi:hypothetical protein